MKKMSIADEIKDMSTTVARRELKKLERRCVALSAYIAEQDSFEIGWFLRKRNIIIGDLCVVKKVENDPLRFVRNSKKDVVVRFLGITTSETTLLGPSRVAAGVVVCPCNPDETNGEREVFMHHCHVYRIRKLERSVGTQKDST